MEGLSIISFSINDDFEWIEKTSQSKKNSLVKTKKYLCNHFSCSSCPAYMQDYEVCSLEEATSDTSY